MIPATDILIIGRTWIIAMVLSWIGWPITSRLFGKLIDGGWAVSRLVLTLIISIVIWIVSYLGIPVNSNEAVWILLLATIGFGLIKGIKVDKKYRLWIGVEELLFAFGFWFQSIVRSFNPKILDLEKFMDFGFVKQYLISSTLPASDMWLAGEKINYYAFGHFWTSIMIRIWQIPPEIGYNLMLALILGLALSVTFSIVINISKTFKSRLFGGVAASLLVGLAGNGHIIWQMVSKRTLDGYWYADATRFIYHTIHEFPGYSFVVSDLHGHLLGLPVVLCFVLTMVAWVKNKNVVLALWAGVLLGMMAMTNTWDVAIYGMLMVFLALFICIRDKKQIEPVLINGGVIATTMILTAITWMINFQSIAGGVKLVTLRSPLDQLAILWLPQVIISVIALMVALRKKENLISAMVICAILLLIIPEIIYVKDIYPEHPRANTMFKLTYQAFVMMGIVVGWAFGQVTTIKNKLVRYLFGVIAMVSVVGVMIFPVNAFNNYYDGFKKYQGLDGSNWIKTKNPDRWQMIEFLKKSRDGKNLVEAVGDSYTELNMLSVFSGVPTVVGWRVHEWLWRGGYDEVGKRDMEVKEIYEGTDLSRTETLLAKYNVGWIAVGNEEKDKYKVNEEKLLSLGKIILKTKGGYLIRITESH